MMNRKLNIRKTVITVVALNLIQIGAIASFLLYLAYHNSAKHLKGWGIQFRDVGLLLGIVLLAILINSIIAIRDAVILMQADAQSEMLKESLAQVKGLNNTLRAQRHDFLNHLQVVFGLMELSEYDTAKGYIEKVYSDIQKISRVLKTASPAMNALLQAKMMDAEKWGIEFIIEISTSLKSLIIPDWELCRVVGNIIDNAIDALKDVPNPPESGRNITMEVQEDLTGYTFRIKNNGAPIPPASLPKIFEPGFTTKGDEGEGMGLAISREILTGYGGNIQVTSDGDFTIFTGWLPKA
jgi:sensor histidine kinase regulating citrate/malate metabolism